ncbi:MAG: ThiF family adenylyltransferase, partial [Gammaproteobacteria bacterium]
MIELTISAQETDALVRHVTDGETELCAVLFTTHYVRRDGLARLLVREMDLPNPEDYARVGRLEAELTPDYVARVSKRARLANLGIVFVHSHPGNFPPIFSDVDDAGEQVLSAFTANRNVGHVHLALVVSRGGMNCRELGTQNRVRVVSVGTDRDYLTDSLIASTHDHRYDRQVRAFGAAGQEAISRVRVAIVGLGGTGSIVSQELAHLGVRDFILIDPDIADETNLNRIANAGQADLGKPKVEVARRYISAVDERAHVELVQGNITRTKFAKPLTDADLIFGCTDSHGSRAVMQLISYQYLI